MKKPKVAIIISTYNQEKLLEKCLASIKNKTDYKNYKIYVVDDSGKGEIGKKIKRKFRKVEVVINKKNIGFSKSNNIGIKRAAKEYNPDYFLLLNDDTEMIEKNWLKNMVEVGEKDKKIGVLGCQIIYSNGELQNIGGYIREWKIDLELDKNKKEVFEVDHVMGAFIIIKKDTIKEVGVLDEIYSPYLLEDTDYCLRAKKRGWKIVSVPYVKIIHKKGKSIDSLEDRKRLEVRFRNDIIFSQKHLKEYNKFFRIFIYLPLVAMFRKKKDTDNLRFNRMCLRERPLRNLKLWFKAIFKGNKTY